MAWCSVKAQGQLYLTSIIFLPRELVSKGQNGVIILMYVGGVNLLDKFENQKIG
jgi:hypothetical protein